MEESITATMSDEKTEELFRLAVALDQLGFCSCSFSADAYNLLREVLASFDVSDESHDRSQVKQRLGDGRDDALYILTLSLLESTGLIEHGGNVRSGFLSEAGRGYWH